MLIELVEPVGTIVFDERLQSTKSADSTLSALELSCTEYQESNALLCKPEDVPLIERIGARERCPVDAVGTVTDNGKVIRGDLISNTYVNCNVSMLYCEFL